MIKHMSNYYNPIPALQALDINGQVPKILIVDGNRTSGKTTGFLGELFRNWVDTGQQFACGYKWTGDIGASESIFSYITSYCDPETGEQLFPDIEFDSLPIGKGALYELRATRPNTEEGLETFGYCFSLNGSSKVRKYRSLLSNVSIIYYDDFLPEDGKYCPNELDKFQSIYLTIAGANRPDAEHLRNVRVIMTSNHTELSNPYYMSIGITKRFQANCKWLRGDGWVWHRDDNSGASSAIKRDTFLNIFGNYGTYASGESYLTNTSAGVERLRGRMRYVCTIKVNQGMEMCAGVYYHYDSGYLYISSSVDPSSPITIAPVGQSYSDDISSTKAGTRAFILLIDAENTGKIRYETLEQKSVLYMLLGKKLGG
jgi:hypothetical protein